VGRIGGYGPESEVYNPVVYLKSPPSNALFRVTALLSRYTEDEAKSAEEIPVQGIGNALKVHFTNYDDFIYAGNGYSTFDRFSTDANVAFVRQYNDTIEITLLEGSIFDYQNMRWVNITKKTDYFTFKKVGNSLDYIISKGQDPGGLLFPNTTPTKNVDKSDITEVKTTSLNILIIILACTFVFSIVRFFVKK
jgi:hypothetical protein